MLLVKIPFIARPLISRPRTARPFIAAALLLWSCAGSAQAATVSVNFREAEIEDVVESLAGVTGGTFILDPRVKGKMTIVSPEPMAADMLYEVFLSALQVHGFQAVNDGAAIRIVPNTRAINIPVGKAGGELITEVIPLHYTKVAEVVPVLKPLVSQGAQISFHAATNDLVITDSVAQVRRMKDVLRDLDSAATHDFDVVTLQHTSASEVVAIANAMGILTDASKIVDDVTANRLIISGSKATRAQLLDLIRALDAKTNLSSGIEVIYLNHADAVDIQPVLETMIKSSAFLAMSGEKTATENSYTVQADKANNALIVAASSGVTAAIKAIVEKLDQPRAQVLIEAVIAEVSEDFFNQFSVNLAQIGSSGAFISDFTGTIGAIAGAAESGTDTDRAAVLESLKGRAVMGGASIDRDGNGGIAGIIEAIKTDNRSTLLSTPSILTLENEEALISIGQEVPFVTGSFTTTSSGASNPFQTIEREEVGTILKVTPQINQGDSIRLEINQEVSSVNQATVVGTSDTNVTTDKKMIETNVIVNNNQLLVLGGLMDNSFSDVDSKVPLLGDLPLLGRLFRSTERTQNTSILMVFIRPTIIRTVAEGNTVSQRKYRVLEGTHSGFVERNKVGDEVAPLPKELGDVDILEDMMKK